VQISRRSMIAIGTAGVLKLLIGCRDEETVTVGETVNAPPTTQPRQSETVRQAMNRIGISYEVARNADGSVTLFSGSAGSGRKVVSVRGHAVAVYAYDGFTASQVQQGIDVQMLPRTWREIRWYNDAGDVVVRIRS
jgi:hypothetical protein